MSEHWPVTANSLPTLPTGPADGHPAFLSSSAGRMGVAPHMQGQDPCPGDPKTCMLSHSCARVLSHFSPIQLCNPVDCSPSGSSVHGILQARRPEWAATPSSRGSSQPRDQTWARGSTLPQHSPRRLTVTADNYTHASRLRAPVRLGPHTQRTNAPRAGPETPFPRHGWALHPIWPPHPWVALQPGVSHSRAPAVRTHIHAPSSNDERAGGGSRGSNPGLTE